MYMPFRASFSFAPRSRDDEPLSIVAQPYAQPKSILRQSLPLAEKQSFLDEKYVRQEDLSPKAFAPSRNCLSSRRVESSGSAMTSAMITSLDDRFKEQPKSTAASTVAASKAVIPPRSPPVDIVTLYNAVVSLQGTERADFLPFDHITRLGKLDAHQWNLRRQRRRQVALDPQVSHVCPQDLWKENIDKVCLYASSPTDMGGLTYDIPILVKACVEAYERFGITQQGIFWTLPNLDRCDRILGQFYQGPSFGKGVDLGDEQMRDVFHVLSCFIRDLPEQLIDPCIFASLFEWCVRPSSLREYAKRKELRSQALEELIEKNQHVRVEAEEMPPIDMPVIWTKEEKARNEELEVKQIATAVLLLKLMPTAHFGVLAYLLRFFSQLGRVPDPDLSFDDCAKKLSYKLNGFRVPRMGDPVCMDLRDNAVQARHTMLWLLHRWPKISAQLWTQSKSVYEAMKQKVNPHTESSMVASASEENIAQRAVDADCLVLGRSSSIESVAVTRRAKNDMHRSSTSPSRSRHEYLPRPIIRSEPSLVREVHANSTPQTDAIGSQEVMEAESNSVSAVTSPVASSTGISFARSEVNAESNAITPEKFDSEDALALDIASRSTKTPLVTALRRIIADRDATISRLEAENIRLSCLEEGDTKREHAKYKQALSIIEQAMKDITLP